MAPLVIALHKALFFFFFQSERVDIFYFSTKTYIVGTH